MIGNLKYDRDTGEPDTRGNDRGEGNLDSVASWAGHGRAHSISIVAGRRTQLSSGGRAVSLELTMSQDHGRRPVLRLVRPGSPNDVRTQRRTVRRVPKAESRT